EAVARPVRAGAAAHDLRHHAGDAGARREAVQVHAEERHRAAADRLAGPDGGRGPDQRVGEPLAGVVPDRDRGGRVGVEHVPARSTPSFACRPGSVSARTAYTMPALVLAHGTFMAPRTCCAVPDRSTTR